MSIETIQYRGFDINIEQDMGAENPWKMWDGNPPMYAHYDRGGDEYGLDLSIPRLTREQIKANAQAIASELGCSTLLRACTANLTYSRYQDGREKVYHALCEHAEGLNQTDLLEFIVAVYGWAGAPSICVGRNGYSQSDWVELLIVATPEWLKETGATITKPEDLETYADLYAAWAFGDVYGFVIPEIGDSCWGFYGSDHRESGLLEHAENSIDCEIERRAVEKQASEVMLLTGCGGVG